MNIRIEEGEIEGGKRAWQGLSFMRVSAT